MKEQIVFDKDELEEKMLEFCYNLKEYSGKKYGFHLVSNETEKRIKNFDEIVGTILLIWAKTFKTGNK